MNQQNQYALQYEAGGECASEVITMNCDTLALSMTNVQPGNQGRILEVNVRVRKVRPCRELALAVFLYEVDEQGKEYMRGVRILALSAHHAEESMDILVEKLMFILPETAPAPEIKLRLRAVAHYINL